MAHVLGATIVAFASGMYVYYVVARTWGRR